MLSLSKKVQPSQPMIVQPKDKDKTKTTKY